MSEFKDMSTDDIHTAIDCLKQADRLLECASNLVTGDILDYAFDFSAIESAIETLEEELAER